MGVLGVSFLWAPSGWLPLIEGFGLWVGFGYGGFGWAWL